jgi:hypothetical protein
LGFVAALHDELSIVVCRAGQGQIDATGIGCCVCGATFCQSVTGGRRLGLDVLLRGKIGNIEYSGND